MKRADLVRHLEAHGCQLLREGVNHSVHVNRAARKTSTVPGHREINDSPGVRDGSVVLDVRAA
jgi:predicted RNA binding protein YcfA (HicA-like mRNA interferase family)